jgi:hypothetical protein
VELAAVAATPCWKVRMSARRTVLCISLLITGVAHASDETARPPTSARELFQQGSGHFALEEYDAAITSWEEGFRQQPAPEFLYNIAQAYRLSHRPERALAVYRKYLEIAPSASNRASVERQIAALRRVVAQQRRAAEQPPQEAIAPKGGLPPNASASLAPSAPAGAAKSGADEPSQAEPSKAEPSSTAPTARAVPLVVSTEPPPGADEGTPRKPITKKAWFWGVIGASAAVVVGAVVVGAVVGTRQAPAPNVLAVRF